MAMAFVTYYQTTVPGYTVSHPRRGCSPNYMVQFSFSATDSWGGGRTLMDGPPVLLTP